ncbi:MAG: hypothetical protein U9Q07_15680, partial [Planctomycetota bacterium]|nr:hypothetical protein [Planctomycetota bacterium]
KRCDARSLTVRLKLPAGEYTVRVFDPKTGKTTKLPIIESDGTVSLAIPKFREDTALSMKRQQK